MDIWIKYEETMELDLPISHEVSFKNLLCSRATDNVSVPYFEKIHKCSLLLSAIGSNYSGVC